jgi:hypothetical protein
MGSNAMPDPGLKFGEENVGLVWGGGGQAASNPINQG